jgi:hypothetical protein
MFSGFFANFTGIRLTFFFLYLIRTQFFMPMFKLVTAGNARDVTNHKQITVIYPWNHLISQACDALVIRSYGEQFFV